ncbi:MAG: hypothetical protein JXB10_19875 [Pirellulales bacterium]|nr:hypothetical protein [Pirellulales bacterium]
MAAPGSGASTPGATPPTTYGTPSGSGGTNFASPPNGSTNFIPPNNPAPAATFGGNIQTPTPGWDPYGAAGGTPSTLLPQDPYFQAGAPAIPSIPATKLIQNIQLDYHWFIGHGEGQLGINDVQLDVTAAFPLFFNSATPLLVTPGFATHWWEGPVTIAPYFADLPPQTFDAYIIGAWNPQVTQWLGGELMFQTGLFTDFAATVSSNDLRYRGSGVAVLNFSPNFKIKAGVMYLDRLRVKLLPTGGFVWTPNQDVEIAMLFPNPRLRRRLMNYGSFEWWLYASGDYGGGNWSIVRADIPEVNPAVRGQRDEFDYNDIRMALGLEFTTPRNLNGFVEGGIAFERELRYQSGYPVVYYPKTTFFIHAGLSY